MLPQLRTSLGLAIMALVLLAPIAVAEAQPSNTAAARATVNVLTPSAPIAPDVVSRSPEGGVSIRAVRLSEPLTVDGVLDDPIYATTPAIGGFVQQDPHEGEPATEQTDVWVFFDNRNIYVSARCWDSHPERYVANDM